MLMLTFDVVNEGVAGLEGAQVLIGVGHYNHSRLGGEVFVGRLVLDRRLFRGLGKLGLSSG